MFKALLKVRIRGLFSGLFGQFAKKTQKRGPLAAVGIALLIGFVAVLLLFCIVMMALSFGVMLLPSGRDWIYFGFFAILAVFLAIFGSFMHAKNMLFDSKDNDILIPMPIPPVYILLSRVASLLLSAFLYVLAVLVPAGIVYCFFLRVTFFSVLGFLFGILSLTLLSTAISAFFGYLLALLSRFFRNKTLITVLLTVGFLAVYFVIYGSLMQLDVENTEAIEQMLLLLEASLANTPVAFLGYALIGDLLPLLLLVLLAAASFSLVLFLLSRGFLTVTRSENAMGRRRAYRLDADKKGSMRRSLFKKDFRLLFHNATYLINAALGPILLLFLAGFLIFAGGGLYEELLLLSSELSDPSLELPFFAALEFILVPIGVLLFFTAVGSMTVVTAPSISVEAKTLWQLQALPVRPIDAMLSKAYVQIAVTLPPLLLAVVAASIVFRVPFYIGILLFLAAALFSFFSSLFGLMINLLLPKFNAISMAHAVKQSGSALITIFAMMALSLVIGLLGFVFVALFGSVIYLLLVILMTATLSGLCLFYLATRGSRRFARLSP